jgi:hypothetical protein
LQGLNGFTKHGNGQYGTGVTPAASSTADDDSLAKLHPLMMSFTNAHDQVCVKHTDNTAIVILLL